MAKKRRKRQGSRLAITQDALRDAIQGAYNTDLQPFRSLRRKMIRRYIGSNYSDTVTDKYPVNMVSQTVNTWMRMIVAGAPRALVTTPVRELKPLAVTLGLKLDREIDRMRLKETLRRAAQDAIFSMGIARVGLERSGEVALGGSTHSIMSTFVDIISLDNFAFDTAAHEWRQMRFICDKFRIPRKLALDSGEFDNAVIEKLPAVDTHTSVTSTPSPVRNLSFNHTRHDRLPEQIELWNVWMPYERELRVVTAAADEFKKVSSKEFDGPEDGPYRILGFNTVPDNVMPRSPLADIMDLNELLNKLFVKMGDQAIVEKQVLGYLKGEGEEDAQNIIAAKNTEAIGMNDPDNVQIMNIGGVSQLSFAFSLQIKDVLNSLAGNLEALAGLGPQAETLGQEQIIKESASVLVQDMADRMREFVSAILGDIAYYEIWGNPLMSDVLTKQIAGTDIEIDVELNQEVLLQHRVEKAEDFLKFNFDVVPHSMEDKGPGGEIAIIMQALNSIFFPGLEMLQQQGGMIDFEVITDVLARGTGIDAFKDLIKFEEPQIPPAEAIGQPPRQSPVTTRHEIRTNRPGATRAGKDGALTQMIMAQAGGGGRPGVQPNESASIGRPNS